MPLYFSPIGPRENVILVSLDPQSGERRWAINNSSTQRLAGGGAPLMLNDPDQVGQQIIYLGVYDRAVAVRQNGEVTWDVDTGLVEPTLGPENIPASIAVSSENGDLYAVSLANIYKLRDLGDSAELIWEATLDVFPEPGPYRNFNMTTATIVSNGIAVTVGAGLTDGNFTLPLKFGVGLLDGATGKLLSYNPAREESVSVTMVAADGGFYLANSPERRAVARALFGPLVRPLTEGISRYKLLH